MSDHTRCHRLEGLEPDNLLAFIALLGLLRALDTARPSWRARTAWDLDQPPLRPVLHLAEPQSRDVISRAAAEGISRLAECYVFPAAPGGNERQLDLNYSTVRARELLIEAASNEERERADVLAALMCDAAGRDGRIEATPFCLLFGQGHQHFLERLSQIPRLEAPPRRGRGKAAIELTPAETIAEALFQPWERRDPPLMRWPHAAGVEAARGRNCNDADREQVS